MLAGRLYFSIKDKQLASEWNHCQTLLKQYNDCDGEETDKKFALLEQILQAKLDPKSPPLIQPPFRCEYGYNIRLGRGVYMNFGCTFLDCNVIEIGDDVLFGPNVQIYPPQHPIDPLVRNGLRGPEYALPVRIGNNCWIGGAAIIMGGVTVGEGCIIGAGAVVTRDIPPWCVAVGSPARVVKQAKPGDKTAKELP
ncbi:hypothetical protein WJX73_006031 [Symbiochloris irregularis]|uniref:Maltose/galactoside acetyltransferase domain-containing protein n=1 Tax=Symbiochloris irregularis TaxID=706552 RepID=A0AAW1PGZ8_9CHLO